MLNNILVENVHKEQECIFILSYYIIIVFLLVVFLRILLQSLSISIEYDAFHHHQR